MTILRPARGRQLSAATLVGVHSLLRIIHSAYVGRLGIKSTSGQKTSEWTRRTTDQCQHHQYESDANVDITVPSSHAREQSLH